MSITHWKPFREIERWEPFHDIGSLRQEMDRMFDRFMAGFDGGHERSSFIPSAEMDETDKEIHLKLEVPGLDAKDLDVSVTEDSVSIKGERQTESKTEEEGMVRSEFRYGTFERIIPLPAPVQSDKTNAEYKNGILHLTLPKAEGERKRIVKVKVAS